MMILYVVTVFCLLPRCKCIPFIVDVLYLCNLYIVFLSNVLHKTEYITLRNLESDLHSMSSNTPTHTSCSPFYHRLQIHTRDLDMFSAIFSLCVSLDPLDLIYLTSFLLLSLCTCDYPVCPVEPCPCTLHLLPRIVYDDPRGLQPLSPIFCCTLCIYHPVSAPMSRIHTPCELPISWDAHL